MQFKGQSIVVFGFGKSGVSTVRYLLAHGADVTVVDEKSEDHFRAHIDTLSTQDSRRLHFYFGRIDERVFRSAHMIVLSPGIPKDLALIQECVAHGVDLVNEPELAFRDIHEPVIAITGTNGKTTTTTLIGEIIRASGRSVFVGGNIGTPLLDYVVSGRRVDFVVAELSSYQLELIRSLTPRVAVFTNISQNHLDRYSSMQSYVAAKHRLRELSTQETTVVVNEDSPWLDSFRLGPCKELLSFSTQHAVNLGAQWTPSLKTIDLKLTDRSLKIDMHDVRIPGVHNIENYMAAFCATWSVGIEPGAFHKVVESFMGVAHRIEFVRERAGVKFYNDSKSTTVESLITCLTAFPDGCNIAILGGKDKGSDFAPLIPYLTRKCREIFVYGAAQNKIIATLQAALGHRIHAADTFERAVREAASVAVAGENVILSPACASQDLFQSFEHRGDVFKEIVMDL